MIAERVALGIQNRAPESLYSVRRINPAVKAPLSGLLTPHSEFTAVLDMAPPTLIAPKRLLMVFVIPR